MSKNKTFTNNVKAITKRKWGGPISPGDYGYDKPSPLMFRWSRTLQAVVSQALTYMYTGKFHDQQCGIYKSEGGCNIPDIGELCLGSCQCYWDAGGPPEISPDPAELITKIVLEWNPMGPIESMVKSAAQWLGMGVGAFKDGTKESRCSGVFGGDGLSSFFDWNPFSVPPIDRDYERYCLVNFGDMTDAQVDQKWADQDLGKLLLDKINDKIRGPNKETLHLMALCCSPRRFDDNKLHFWINTGRSTQIDGWKTETQINKFLKSNGKLCDTMK